MDKKKIIILAIITAVLSAGIFFATKYFYFKRILPDYQQNYLTINEPAPIKQVPVQKDWFEIDVMSRSVSNQDFHCFATTTVHQANGEDVVKTYGPADFNCPDYTYSVEYVDQVDNIFWLKKNVVVYACGLFKLNAKTDSLEYYPLYEEENGASSMLDFSFNVQRALAVYGDCPTYYDAPTSVEEEEQRKSVTCKLYLYDIENNSREELALSSTHFMPKWLDNDTLEYSVSSDGKNSQKVVRKF